MIVYVHQFLLHWVFTLFIEVPIFVLFVTYSFKISRREFPLRRLIFGGIFASSITIPWVWFVFPVLFYNSMLVAAVLSETFAFAAEIIFYTAVLKLPLRQAIFISFAANASSFLLGLVLF